MSRSYNNAGMTTLDEFESRLQSLLEVHLLKHLPGYKAGGWDCAAIGCRNAQSFKRGGRETQAPNLYVIVAHPSTLHPLACQTTPAKGTCKCIICSREGSRVSFLDQANRGYYR